jgi:hypothetical protein
MGDCRHRIRIVWQLLYPPPQLEANWLSDDRCRSRPRQLDAVAIAILDCEPQPSIPQLVDFPYIDRTVRAAHHSQLCGRTTKLTCPGGVSELRIPRTDIAGWGRRSVWFGARPLVRLWRQKQDNKPRDVEAEEVPHPVPDRSDLCQALVYAWHLNHEPGRLGEEDPKANCAQCEASRCDPNG